MHSAGTGAAIRSGDEDGAVVQLILVRHGQTESNVEGLLDAGAPGAPLTALGRQQADALPERLTRFAVTRVIASPLLRTVQTAQPLLAAVGVDLVTDEGLREVLAGDLELRRDPEAHRAYLAPVFAWAQGDLDRRIPGSPEDGHDFFARFDAAVGVAVAGPDEAVAVISHGAAIRTWAAVRAKNLPDDHGREHGLPNTGVVVLQGGPGRWRALEWQDDRFGDAEDDPTGAAEQR